MADVAITGLGVVWAKGLGVPDFWKAVRDGETGVSPTRFDRWLGNKVRISAQPDHEAIAAHFEASALAALDPVSQYALLASAEALAQAGLAKSDIAGLRTACIIGCAYGGAATQDDGYHAFYCENKLRVQPLTIPRIMASAPASQISMAWGINGPTFAISSACSSASQAIGLGFQMVRAGLVDRAIVGGADASVTPATTRTWEMMRVLAPDYCRPFSKGRNGMVLGEGAGILILEKADLAKARGARPLSYLLGYGTTSDALDLLRADPAGAAASMRQALVEAAIDACSLGYVNAHGTGTLLNDASETEAMAQAFGEVGRQIPLSSTKPIHGHTLGAAGALELIATIMALREQIVPPTINWLEWDPSCDVNVIKNQAQPAEISAAMSNSFAFGGINASLIVGHPDI